MSSHQHLRLCHHSVHESLSFEYLNPLESPFSGGGVEHPLQIAIDAQDVAVGEEHVHGGHAQDLAHEETSLRPKVRINIRHTIFQPLTKNWTVSEVKLGHHTANRVTMQPEA